MKTRRKSTRLRKIMVTLLTVALFLSDHMILYAAQAGAVQAAAAEDTRQTERKENPGTVSDGDVSKGDDTAAGKGEKPPQDKNDISDLEENVLIPGGSAEAGGLWETVSGGDSGTVSGGDALKPGRLPESFYEEEKPETYGTLVSYDRYSRTYHVDGNRYVTVRRHHKAGGQPGQNHPVRL